MDERADAMSRFFLTLQPGEDSLGERNVVAVRAINDDVVLGDKCGDFVIVGKAANDNGRASGLKRLRVCRRAHECGEM